VKVSGDDYDTAWADLDTDDVSEGTTNLYNRVPTGGVSGQVLAKVSATDYDLTWQPPGLPVAPPVVGEFISPFSVGVGANAAPPENEVQAQMAFIPRPITVDRMIVDVRVAGSVPCEGRMGIYASDSDGRPSSLIVDAGLFDASSTGIKSITLSPAVTLPQGVVFFCIVRQTANSFFINCSANSSGLMRGMFEISAFGGAGNVPNLWGYRQSGVTGALPSTFTPASSDSFRVFRFGVRIGSVL
jgi:hypothetical protein